jgi:selenocysteine-specific elongation factor
VRHTAGQARFEALDPRSGGGTGRGMREPDLDAASLMIRDAGLRALPVVQLGSRAGVAPGGAEALAERLVAIGAAVRVGDLLVDATLMEQLRRDLVALIGEHHRSAPLSDGLPREEARARLCAHAPVAVFDRVLQDLAGAGTLVGRDRLALASHQLVLSPEEERVSAALVETFRASGLKPPEAGALALELGVPARVVDKLVGWLVRRRVLVRIDTLLFHRDAIERLRSDLAEIKALSGGAARIDVGTFKDRYGISRKFAIPLLEFLDRERITKRQGDTRVLM